MNDKYPWLTEALIAEMSAHGAERESIQHFEAAFHDGADLGYLDLEWIAAQPFTPQDALESLSRSDDPDVREEVIFNPSSPMKLLKSMWNDSDAWVAGFAIEQYRLRQEHGEEVCQ